MTKYKHISSYDIKEMYENNVLVKDIAKHFGIDRTTVYDRLNGLNVKLRGHINLIEYNRSYFNKIDSPIKAYFMGFILGDGTVCETPNYQVRLELHEQDEKLLKRFASEIGMDHIHVKTSYGHDTQKVVYLGSKEIVTDLMSHGMPTKGKSYVAKPLDLSDSLMQYFWLGLWDADGSISKIKHAPCSFEFEFTGTKELCEGLSYFLEYEGNYVNKRPKTKAYRFRKVLSFVDDLKRVYHQMYDNTPYCLPRKKEKFEKFIKNREDFENGISNQA